MTNNQIKELIQNNFDFLLTEFSIYKIMDFKDYFLFELKSKKVIIRFTFNKRDCYLNVLFEKIIDGKVHPGYREAMGDLSDLFNDKYFILREFYLWEILEYKKKNVKMEYNFNFQLNESLNNAAILIKKYAMEFVKGDENAYLEMDKWMRKKINK